MQASLFSEYSRPQAPSRIGRAEVRERPHNKVLTVARGIVADRFDYTLNPYVGCGFGCSYCFAANFVADEEKKRTWGQWIEAKEGAERQLAHADLRGKRIFMSSATDPYQPLERKLGLTRRIVEILADKGAHLTVQTRSPIVVRDLDLFKKFTSIQVNMSITTDSEEIRKQFEPSCASIDQRFEALEDIGAAGIPTMVCVSPMLPIRDVRQFAERIKSIRPARVVTSYFHFKRGPFAASTRDEGLRLLQECGWDRGQFDQTRRELARLLPMMTTW